MQGEIKILLHEVLEILCRSRTLKKVGDLNFQPYRGLSWQEAWFNQAHVPNRFPPHSQRRKLVIAKTLTLLRYLVDHLRFSYSLNLMKTEAWASSFSFCLQIHSKLHFLWNATGPNKWIDTSVHRRESLFDNCC